MTSKDERESAEDAADLRVGESDSDAAPSVNAPPDDAAPESAATEPADAETEARAKPRGANALLLGAGAVAVVALVFAVWFGVAWISAAGDDDLSVDRARDEVSRVGEAAVVTLNTLDYRQLDRDLDRWAAATTGPLLENINGDRAAAKATIEQGKLVTTARVLKSAVTQLNDREGTAQIMVAIVRDFTPDGGEAETAYLRIQGALDRTETGWKLSNVGTVDFAPPGS
ncbi:hypothetical protein [Actinokineospora pegani]|uniref:hypothetical protein n=1 Tax=Actinokineospora pegani TaxID=2654637 RepID=UPI0012E9E77B|nr:hypothetical protein [Actinokineospora pegani]